MAKTNRNAMQKTRRTRRIGRRRVVELMKRVADKVKCQKIVKQALYFGVAMGVVKRHGVYFALKEENHWPDNKPMPKWLRNYSPEPWRIFRAREAKRALQTVKRALQYGILNHVVTKHGDYYRLVNLDEGVPVKIPFKPEPLSVRKARRLIIDKVFNQKRPLSNGPQSYVSSEESDFEDLSD